MVGHNDLRHPHWRLSLQKVGARRPERRLFYKHEVVPVVYTPDVQYIIERVLRTRTNARTRQRESLVKYLGYRASEGGLAWVPTSSINETLTNAHDY